MQTQAGPRSYLHNAVHDFWARQAWSRMPFMVTQFSLGKIAVMLRPGNRPAGRRTASWRIAMFIATLGFILRALVPLGFMPDARAMQAGHIELTLCSPAMAKSSARSVSMLLSADAADARSSSPAASAGTYRLTLGPTEHSSESLAQQVDCPFALMAAQGLLGTPEVSIAFAPAAHPPRISQLQDSVLALPTLGPPLGSRAPPAIA